MGELGTRGRWEDEDWMSPGAFGTAPLRMQDLGGPKEEEGFGLSCSVQGTAAGRGRLRSGTYRVVSSFELGFPCLE